MILRKTALHYAAIKGDPELAEILIEYNASVDIADKDGSTPIIDAAFLGNLSVLKVLIEQGKADPNIPNKDQMSPLHWVRKSKI